MKQEAEFAGDVGVAAPSLFAPDWGKRSRLLWEIVAAAQAGELLSSVEKILSEIPGNADAPDLVRVAFSLSLLRDVLRSGGKALVKDSRLFIGWPDWSGGSGRNAARQALALARDMRPLTEVEIRRISPLFAPDIDGQQLADVLATAEFALRPVTEPHPSGLTYQAAFGAALRYWTMPYRGRSGRMRRFVLTATHPTLGPWPVVAGILELGDEAPFCTWRDNVLGLSPTSFGDWLKGGVAAERATMAAARLRRLRACLRPTSDGWDLSVVSADSVVQQRFAIEKASHGRSRVLQEQRDLLKDRKRLAYGLRLARGEVGLRKVATEGCIDVRDPDIVAGIRGLHDLILPRLHLEATVCGAVPPFAQALGGKLLVSFLTHPDVISAPANAENELLAWSFDVASLDQELPKAGMLCLTTKGLYANHAAIYNRGEAPGFSDPVRMFHLDNTDGNTTSLVSAHTTRLARQLLECTAGTSMQVSDVYGSGGAKRHRAIEKATVEVGLSRRLANAGIRRPVYGMKFVSNPAAVCWLSEEPQWLVDRTETREAFCSRAIDLWRRRWLRRGIDRIHEYALVPSLTRMLLAGDSESAHVANQ